MLTGLRVVSRDISQDHIMNMGPEDLLKTHLHHPVVGENNNNRTTSYTTESKQTHEHTITTYLLILQLQMLSIAF